jgi:glycosyltransferase involved in cell wall biosynthesis
MKHNILYLTPDFNYADGRSYYVYLLLKYFKKKGHKVYLCTNAGDSFDRVEELGIKIFTYPGLSKKSFFLKSLKFLSEIVKQYNIGIIHSHHRYYELLANSLIGIENVYTVFTALSIVDKRYFVEYKSDRIIAVSNTVKEMLIKKFNVGESRICMIPNFVDSEEITGNPEEKKGNGNPIAVNEIIILSIGRFHKEKSYQTLLKAILILKNPYIKLILVGEGDEMEDYKRIIEKNNLKVRFYPPQRNLKEFFDICSICVLASIRDPFPGFMLQSGLNKKMFIGSDTDGIAELIKDGINGFLFEKRNEYELADRIKLAIENSELAAKCANNLHRMVLDKYTDKAVVPQIESLYNNLFQ